MLYPTEVLTKYARQYSTLFSTLNYVSAYVVRYNAVESTRVSSLFDIEHLNTPFNINPSFEKIFYADTRTECKFFKSVYLN